MIRGGARRREYVPGDKVRSLMRYDRENPIGVITEVYENNPLIVMVHWEGSGQFYEARVTDIELVEAFVSEAEKSHARAYAHEQIARAQEILRRYS